jgi:hypothetical protein
MNFSRRTLRCAPIRLVALAVAAVVPALAQAAAPLEVKSETTLPAQVRAAGQPQARVGTREQHLAMRRALGLDLDPSVGKVFGASQASKGYALYGQWTQAATNVLGPPAVKQQAYMKDGHPFRDLEETWAFEDGALVLSETTEGGTVSIWSADYPETVVGVLKG